MDSHNEHGVTEAQDENLTFLLSLLSSCANPLLFSHHKDKGARARWESKQETMRKVPKTRARLNSLGNVLGIRVEPGARGTRISREIFGERRESFPSLKWNGNGTQLPLFPLFALPQGGGGGQSYWQGMGEFLASSPNSMLFHAAAGKWASGKPWPFNFHHNSNKITPSLEGNPLRLVSFPRGSQISSNKNQLSLSSWPHPTSFSQSHRESKMPGFVATAFLSLFSPTWEWYEETTLINQTKGRENNYRKEWGEYPTFERHDRESGFTRVKLLARNGSACYLNFLSNDFLSFKEKKACSVIPFFSFLY